MSFRSSITIAASPRPRVGKTLLARLLADFHLHEGRSVAAFDLNVGERTLVQFLPEKTTIATVRDINGQMALFDRLIADEDTTKVIDLGHESFESFFRWRIRSVSSRKRGAVRSPWRFCLWRRLTKDRLKPIAVCAIVSRRRCWRQCTTKCSVLRSIATSIRWSVEVR